jgi:two-component system, OmpR family, response regulator
MAFKKILLIDDDLELCEELVDTLKSEGHQVECIHEAETAEGLIKNRDFDTILLDYKMPGMTGIDLLKKLKAAGIKSEIIVVSGKPFIEKDIMNEGLTSMVKGVIPKPINPDILLKMIQSKK